MPIIDKRLKYSYLFKNIWCNSSFNQIKLDYIIHYNNSKQDKNSISTSMLKGYFLFFFFFYPTKVSFYLHITLILNVISKLQTLYVQIRTIMRETYHNSPFHSTRVCTYNMMQVCGQRKNNKQKGKRGNTIKKKRKIYRVKSWLHNTRQNV